MSLYDDMFDLEDHFKKYVKNPGKTAILNRKERVALSDAFKNILRSHADMERKKMKTDPVMNAIATILREFEVNRGFDDQG